MIPKKMLSMLSGMSKKDLSKNLEKASKLLSNTNEEELNKILNSKEVADIVGDRNINVKEILDNPNELKKILSSDKATELLNKLDENGK